MEVKPEKSDRWKNGAYVGSTVRMELTDSRSRGGRETGHGEDVKLDGVREAAEDREMKMTKVTCQQCCRRFSVISVITCLLKKSIHMKNDLTTL